MGIVKYRLRHKKTGLFYGPTKGRFDSYKTNLAHAGKFYDKAYIPTFNGDTIDGLIADSQVKKYDIPYTERGRQKYFVTNKSEWELVKYELQESEVTEFE